MSTARSTHSTCARLRAVTKAEDGLSLPELLVTMLLLTIVGTMVVSQFTSISSALQTTDRRLDNTVAAQQAMQVLTKDLRAAIPIQQSSGGSLPAFTSIAPNAVTFYSYVGPRPSRVQYFLTTENQLVRQVATALGTSTPPYWTFPSTSTTTIVTRGVVAPAGQPLFVFLDQAGVPLSSPSTGTAVLAGVRSVDVSLVVQVDPLRQVPAAGLDHIVRPPNLEVQ